MSNVIITEQESYNGEPRRLELCLYSSYSAQIQIEQDGSEHYFDLSREEAGDLIEELSKHFEF